MAIRRSTALVNDLARGFGVRELLRDARIFVYSGSQPATADVAPTGTHLLTFTLDGQPYTGATRSFADITIGGSAVGAITSVTVGGMDFNLLSSDVAFSATAASTAIDIASNINARQNPLNITADTSTEHLYLRCPYWMGAGANNLAFATTVSGSLTATVSGSFSSGVAATNGLNFLESISDGLLTKENGVWQASGLANGTAGWFRFVSGGSTVDGTSDLDIRYDGTVATSGGDMIISTVSILLDAVYTINSGTISESV